MNNDREALLALADSLANFDSHHAIQGWAAELRALASAPAASCADGDAREDFIEYLSREMPAGTVIADPRWWAQAIYYRLATSLAATTPPPKEGDWVMVPRKATEEIIDACLNLVDLTQSDPEDHRYDDGRKAAQSLYTAMIAASPAPPRAEGRESGWIACAERLPERDGLGSVLCFDANRPGAGVWEETMHPSWWGQFMECNEWGPTVTHWMPLPEPPTLKAQQAAPEGQP